MTNSPIANEIRSLMIQGMSAADAMDKVCGAGSFQKFASEVYNDIRSKAA